MPDATPPPEETRPPDVTTVVATRDRAAELVRSLPHHPRPLIVVDNASRDGTAEVAHAAGATVVSLDHNLGAAARNLGAELATTPYVAFADDDSWWAPGALARAASLLDAHPRAALLAARVLVGEDERPDPVTEAMAASPLGRPGDLPGPAVLGFLACSAIVRRDAFLDVGGFSETLHFGGEEELLALDLAAAGWGLAYVPELTVHHHPSSLGRNAAARRRREVRNRLLTAWLRRPARALAREVATAVRSRDGRRGAVDAVRALPSVLRERRPVPPEVEAARRALSRY